MTLISWLHNLLLVQFLWFKLYTETVECHYRKAQA